MTRHFRSHHRAGRHGRRRLVLSALIAVGLATAAVIVHPFLAVTSRVNDADVLVVEGWVHDKILAAAVDEFQTGGYRWLLTSGMRVSADPAENESYATRAAARLVEFGADPHRVMACPAPHEVWNRTFGSAKSVREKIVELGLKPRAIHVLTAGPHARQTWVAYRRAMHGVSEVGIISVPKPDYVAWRWWSSAHGLRWVSKDFVAWGKELLFGPRNVGAPETAKRAARN